MNPNVSTTTTSSLLKSIQNCRHLKISNNEDKFSCIECGLCQEKSETPYVRSITHYKELCNMGISIPVYQLIGEQLRNQVLKFYYRKDKNNNRDKKVEPSLYMEYLQFVKDNTHKILPIRHRVKAINQIYGDHKRYVLEYIDRLSP